MTTDEAAPTRRLRRRRKDVDDARMALVDHIRELRNRLLKCSVAVVVGVIVAFIFYDEIFDFLTHPYCQLPANRRVGGSGCQLAFFGVLEPLAVKVRVSLIGGVIALPVLLYQLWAFITPGLHSRERKWALPFLLTSLALFALGGFFAYITLAKGLQFLLGFAGDNLTAVLGVDRYLKFVTLMLLAFGVSFEFPVVLVFLDLVGIVNHDRLRRARRGAIFGIFVFAAFITPSQDPFTLFAMAIPMCIFYEGCVLFSRLHARAKRRRALANPTAGLADDETSPLDYVRNPDDDLTSALDDDSWGD
jgi:sec-independent protein translocase protein TatC